MDSLVLGEVKAFIGVNPCSTCTYGRNFDCYCAKRQAYINRYFEARKRWGVELASMAIAEEQNTDNSK